jgi:Na+(H+)/acetate symporter ActP
MAARIETRLWSRCLFGNGDIAISWIQILAVALLLAAAVVSAILINSN